MRSNEENVKQVVAKVWWGEANAGIVYTSDAVDAAELKTMELPVESNVTVWYPSAMLIKSAHVDQAVAFIEYVLSSYGQAVVRWRFASLE